MCLLSLYWIITIIPMVNNLAISVLILKISTNRYKKTVLIKRPNNPTHKNLMYLYNILSVTLKLYIEFKIKLLVIPQPTLIIFA